MKKRASDKGTQRIENEDISPFVSKQNFMALCYKVDRLGTVVNSILGSVDSIKHEVKKLSSVRNGIITANSFIKDEFMDQCIRNRDTEEVFMSCADGDLSGTTHVSDLVMIVVSEIAEHIGQRCVVLDLNKSQQRLVEVNGDPFWYDNHCLLTLPDDFPRLQERPHFGFISGQRVEVIKSTVAEHVGVMTDIKETKPHAHLCRLFINSKNFWYHEQLLKEPCEA